MFRQPVGEEGHGPDGGEEAQVGSVDGEPHHDDKVASWGACKTFGIKTREGWKFFTLNWF